MQVELLYDLYANAPPDIACIVLKGAGQKVSASVHTAVLLLCCAAALCFC